jgi:acetyl-CoA synthetase
MDLSIKSFEDYQRVYQHSVEQPEQFWDTVASSFVWKKKWNKVLDWNFKEPDINWFVGGKLNITENCLDRHLADKGDQPALIW